MLGNKTILPRVYFDFQEVQCSVHFQIIAQSQTAGLSSLKQILPVPGHQPHSHIKVSPYFAQIGSLHSKNQ